MKLKNVFVSILLLSLGLIIGFGVSNWLSNESFSTDHVFRPVQPIVSQNEPAPGREIVEISETEKLQPGQMVNLSEYPVGEINIQKLTDNSYWILHNLHGLTLYVGENEALLVDVPDALFVGRLLDRISNITDKPITTLVYTHPHLDHIGGAQTLVDAIKEQGRDLRIIASDQFVEASQIYQQNIPQPTEIVETPVGYFEFDNKQFKVGTPVSVAHSSADSYILAPDKVITFIDFIQPNRLPIHSISGVQNVTGYITFLRHVAGEEWEYANTGHLNISSRQDLELTLGYMKDLYDAWFEVMPQHWGVPAFALAKVKGDYVGVWLRNVFDQVAYEITLKMEDKYGHYPHFEVALDHALKVQWDAFLHYDFSQHPEIRPVFTPIQPER